MKKLFFKYSCKNNRKYLFAMPLIIVIFVSGFQVSNDNETFDKVIEYMNLDVREVNRQNDLRRNKLQEIAPVIVPEGEHWVPAIANWAKSNPGKTALPMLQP